MNDEFRRGRALCAGSAPAVRRRRRRGFTLVELLVVIGIIALLIALLMPALSAAKSQANTIKCASNLHALGHAMQQYANDYKGRIPRGYDYFGAYQAGRILWAEALSKYVNHPVESADLSPARDVAMAKEFKNIDVYQCRDFPNDHQPLDYVANSWSGGNINDDISIVVAKVPRSSEVIFLTEASSTRPIDMFCYHDVWDTSQLPTQGKPSYFRNPDARVLNDNRHRGRINMVFLDGHAATKMYRDVSRRDFDYLWIK